MTEFLQRWMPVDGSAHGYELDYMTGVVHWMMAVLFVGWMLYFVYVLFRFDSSRASAFEWLRHRVGSALYGDQTPGKTLNFVWTSREKPGVFWDNPFAPDAKMIALAQGASAKWRTETVDVIEHYRRHFGSPIGDLMGLAVMTDSDNSCQTALARFADFSFSARAAELPVQNTGGHHDD